MRRRFPRSNKMPDPHTGTDFKAMEPVDSEKLEGVAFTLENGILKDIPKFLNTESEHYLFCLIKRFVDQRIIEMETEALPKNSRITPRIFGGFAKVG